MFIATQLSVFAAVILTSFVFFMPFDSPQWALWLCIGVSFGISCAAGLLAASHARSGIIVLGSLIGIMTGFSLHSLIISDIDLPNPLLSLYLMILLSSTFIGYLCLRYFDSAVTIATSLLGSYFFYRGLSHWIGGYPNEFLIYSKSYTNGKIKEMPYSFHLYVAVILITAGASYLLQN
jgi:hypothetical protein